MTQRHRRSVFVIAVGAAIAAATTVLAALPDQPSRAPDAPRRAALRPARPQAATVQTADRPPEGTEPPNPASGASQRAQVRRVAGRFLRAFLRYQAGQLDSPTRHALRQSATRALADRLLRRPPRPARSLSRRGRLGWLAVVGPFSGQLKVVARVAYRGTGVSLLELGLRQRSERLRVARFYP